MTVITVRGAVSGAADRLLTAQQTRTPCRPVRDMLPDSTVATGYAVQAVLTRSRLDAGRLVPDARSD